MLNFCVLPRPSSEPEPEAEEPLRDPPSYSWNALITFSRSEKVEMPQVRNCELLGVG